MTISLCMIVKNEEQTLGRCLQSIADIVDEMIVVDTGSTDKTREIAREFGARVVDIPWGDDFGEARNYAASQAKGDYIYSADADEEIDEENRERFKKLKEDMRAGRIRADIIQFVYTNQLSQNSVYNYDRELRPKLFRRLVPLVWEGAVHEQLRLSPVVYDSGIEIIHKPHGQHAERDLAIFARMVREERPMSARLLKLYARELYMAGSPENFAEAAAFFAERAETEEDADAVQAACLVALRAARLRNDKDAFFRYAVRLMDGQKCSELCLELGDYYLAAGDPAEALVWFMSAQDAAEPVLDIRAGGAYASERIEKSSAALGLDGAPGKDD